MPNTVIMMSDSQKEASLTGEKCKADGWFGHTDGLHTVSIQVVNFTGRVWIEASLEMCPKEDDWFPIQLTHCTPYVQFPLDPLHPTGDYPSGGDTATVGKSFTINALWLRARLDREYLSDVLFLSDPHAVELLGSVRQIVLAR